jgi:hypothetical protein
VAATGVAAVMPATVAVPMAADRTVAARMAVDTEAMADTGNRAGLIRGKRSDRIRPFSFLGR